MSSKSKKQNSVVLSEKLIKEIETNQFKQEHLDISNQKDTVEPEQMVRLVIAAKKNLNIKSIDFKGNNIALREKSKNHFEFFKEKEFIYRASFVLSACVAGGVLGGVVALALIRAKDLLLTSKPPESHHQLRF